MAFIVALGLLMAAVYPAVLYCTDGTLGSHIVVQKGRDTQKQLNSLTLASINNDFTFRLFKEVALNHPDKNIVFSLLGIITTLALMSLGANGNTLEEILEGLKFNVTETPEADIHQAFGQLIQRLSHAGDQVQISTGNTLFVEKHLQILTEFKEKARSLYQTEAFTADFQQPCGARKLINDYVRKETQGKIKELVSDLDNRTSMVAVNYFFSRGKWKVPFDPDETFMGKFILSSWRPVTVPTMKIEDLRTPYFRDEELHCTVVELNYIGNDKAMFILPDQGKMKQVEASLDTETMRKWKKSLRPRMIDELYIPKFSLSKNYRLENILPELGIRELFSTQADLSGITGDKDIRVYQIVHKALLDVAETGTEADATTRCKIVPLSAKLDSVKVVPKAVLDVAETGTEADAATRFKIVPPSAKLDSVKVIFSRPFLIVIASSNTQIPLLITKVLNPKGD